MTTSTLVRLLLLVSAFGIVYGDYKKFIYDDSFMNSLLEDKFQYLKQSNGGYRAPREYFNFSNVFQPTEDYYGSVNIEEHYFQELKAMEITSSISTTDQWQYSNVDVMLKSGLPEANSSQCAEDLAIISRLVAETQSNNSFAMTRGLQNIQFLRLVDSWGRPPSETYWGNAYWKGSYVGCMLSSLKFEDGKRPMKFRYCWGKLKMKSWPEFDEIRPPTSVRVGLCLPRTCDTYLLKKSHIGTIQKIMEFNFSPFHKDRFNRMIDVYCLPDQVNSLPMSGKIFCLIVVIWLTIIFALSLLSHISPLRLPQLLKSLTFQENFSQFVNSDAPVASNPRVDLRPLGIAKITGSLLVCIAHSSLAHLWTFRSSTLKILEVQSSFYIVVVSIYKVMDLFLVISGILTSYTILSRYPNDNIKSIVRLPVYLGLNLARYLRLAPLTILVITFMKTIYPYIGQGPNWDYGTYKHSIQGKCRASDWWRTLLVPIMFGYRGDYYLNECLLVTWYIVTEMKIFLVIPLALYWVYSDKTRVNSRGLKLVLVGMIISSLGQYKDLSMQQLIYFRQFFTYGLSFAMNMLNSTFGETGYYSPINRLSSMLIGVYAGCLLRSYNDSKIKTWPWYMRGYWFASIVLYELYSFVSPVVDHNKYLQTGEVPSEEIIKLAMVIKPRVDAIIFAIMCLRFASDLAPSIMRTMLPIYKLSKLSLGVFLVHSIVISYVLSSDELTRSDASVLVCLVLVVFVIVVSYLISFPLYLLFESPITLLANKIFSRSKSGQKASRQRKSS